MAKRKTTFEEYVPDIKTLYEIIKWNSVLYNDFGDNIIAKNRLENILANAIFYMTGSKCFYTGYISTEALRLKSLFQVKKLTRDEFNKKTTNEHKYPRKIVTKELLLLNYIEEPWDEFFNIFRKKSVYNITTSKENTKLRPFQKFDVFETPEKAYEKAGIILVKE